MGEAAPVKVQAGCPVQAPNAGRGRVPRTCSHPEGNSAGRAGKPPGSNGAIGPAGRRGFQTRFAALPGTSTLRPACPAVTSRPRPRFRSRSLPREALPDNLSPGRSCPLAGWRPCRDEAQLWSQDCQLLVGTEEWSCLRAF